MTFRKTIPALAAIALIGSLSMATAQTGTGSMGSGTSPAGTTGRSSTTDTTTTGAHMDNGTGARSGASPNSGYPTKTGGPSGGRVDSN